MAATERITMTMRELDRFKVIQDVADGKLKPWRAAERLEISRRQIERLVARYRTGRCGLTKAWTCFSCNIALIRNPRVSQSAEVQPRRPARDNPP